MPKMQELGLTSDQVGENLDYANMPDQMGTFIDPPQPGTFRFKFPARLDDIWEVFDHEKGTPPGKRIRAKFDDTHPLTIIQSPGGKNDGEPFQISITNAERKRGKRDDPTAPTISDMDYFFRDVARIPGKPKNGNVGYAQLFQQTFPSVEFTADVTWSWYCNPNKNIRVDNGQGGYTEVDQKGCGANYYQRDVEKVQLADGTMGYPLRITCSCSANVRAFPNIQNFRA